MTKANLVVSEFVSTTITLGLTPPPFRLCSIPPPAPPNVGGIGPLPPNWLPAMGNPANELCEKAGAPPKEGGGGWDHGKPVLGSGSAGGAGLQGKYLRSGMGPEIFEIEMPSGRLSFSRST